MHIYYPTSIARFLHKSYFYLVTFKNNGVRLGKFQKSYKIKYFQPSSSEGGAVVVLQHPVFFSNNFFWAIEGWQTAI